MFTSKRLTIYSCNYHSIYTLQLNIASASLAGSMMSLDPSADEGKDEFDDETINLVHGIKMEKPKRKKSGKNHETHPTDPDNGVYLVIDNKNNLMSGFI